MKVFSTDKIKNIDEYTIKHEPISSLDLMERASATLFDEFRKLYYSDKKVKVFVGSGNNGGDALVLARMLSSYGTEVTVYLLSSKLSNDAKVNLDRYKMVQGAVVKQLRHGKKLPELSPGDVIVDGILGSGISRPAEGFFATVIQHINDSGCEVFAIDIPSGLFGEDNRNNTPDTIIKAKYTVTFQFPKLSFFFSENVKYVGQWKVTDIGLHTDVIKDTYTPYHYINTENIKNILRKRDNFSHKGNFGHALLLAGSYGKMGAAVLAAKAVLRSGAGLLTAHVPHCGYTVMQTAVPEAMTTIDRSDFLLSEYPREMETYNAVGVGPGIGLKPNTKEMLNNLLLEYDQPMVLDADALNILGEEKEWLKLLPENSILTPHPKEFERIAGKVQSPYERHLLQLEFAKKYNVVVVVKGAFTSVATPDGICCINSTGNPGMATAGSGDVLTGIILGLLSQGYEPYEAAVLGVWLHGRAGDLYEEDFSGESLIASSIVDYLGKAFAQLKR